MEPELLKFKAAKARCNGACVKGVGILNRLGQRTGRGERCRPVIARLPPETVSVSLQVVGAGHARELACMCESAVPRAHAESVLPLPPAGVDASLIRADVDCARECSGVWRKVQPLQPLSENA